MISVAHFVFSTASSYLILFLKSTSLSDFSKMIKISFRERNMDLCLDSTWMFFYILVLALTLKTKSNETYFAITDVSASLNNKSYV